MQEEVRAAAPAAQAAPEDTTALLGLVAQLVDVLQGAAGSLPPAVVDVTQKVFNGLRQRQEGMGVVPPPPAPPGGVVNPPSGSKREAPVIDLEKADGELEAKRRQVPAAAGSGAVGVAAPQAAPQDKGDQAKVDSEDEDMH